MTFEEFYRNLGLTSYPFTTFTTELERDRSVELFVPMTEFGPIQESFRANSTIILLGERGVGKTAVLEEFHRQVRGSQVYAVINEYSELADQPDSSDFHSMILRHLLIAIVSYLGQNPHRARRMDKRDRVLVSYLIYYFSDELTVRSIKDAVDRIQIGRFRRLATNLFNRSRRPLNYAASVLESALKRYIAQNFNLVPFYDESVIHDYFPEIPLESDMSFREGVPRFQLLRRLCELILKSTGHKPIVLLDRLDEDSRLANDAEKIAAFVEPLLTDNNLLGLSELQTILFVWKTPYRFIAEKVRSQKYFCPSIKWDTAALKSVLNKRLEVFSEKRMTDHRELFMSPESDLVGQAFRLANGVPRDLWHVVPRQQLLPRPATDRFPSLTSGIAAG
jgi:Cdc6-like AAA superfamily ATPase